MSDLIKKIVSKLFSKKNNPLKLGISLSNEIKYPIFGFLAAVTIFLTFAAFKDYLKTWNAFNKNQIPSPNFSFLNEKGKTTQLIDPKDLAQVLGEFEDVKAAEDGTIFFNLQARFTAPAVFEENITAPNVVYEITAGSGIIISGDPQSPVISTTEISTVEASALDSIEGLTGNVDLKAGTNISISTSGNTVTINNTASTATATTLEEDDVEAFIFDSDNTGTLSSGTLALGSLSYTGSIPSSVVQGEYTGITKTGILSSLNVTGDVGIGTTAPADQLAVAGGVLIGSDYATLITAPSNGLLVQGNVGIGTTAPGYALDVNGVIQAQSGFRTNGETITDFTGLGLTATGGALTVDLLSSAS